MGLLLLISRSSRVNLIDQVFLAAMAIYFCVGFVACVALYEIRNGKVSAEELNMEQSKIDEIKAMDKSLYLLIFFAWGLAIFAPKGD